VPPIFFSFSQKRKMRVLKLPGNSIVQFYFSHPESLSSMHHCKVEAKNNNLFGSRFWIMDKALCIKVKEKLDHE